MLSIAKCLGQFRKPVDCPFVVAHRLSRGACDNLRGGPLLPLEARSSWSSGKSALVVEDAASDRRGRSPEYTYLSLPLAQEAEGFRAGCCWVSNWLFGGWEDVLARDSVSVDATARALLPPRQRLASFGLAFRHGQQTRHLRQSHLPNPRHEDMLT